MENIKWNPRWDNYQYLEDGKKSHHTDLQTGSKFWDKGKWDNYILPYMPKDPKGLTYIDMGCNAGLFLKFAEDLGFKRSIGVDINPEAIERGIVYRDKNKSKYEFVYGNMQDTINKLPVCDYMSFISSHYYVLVQEWMDLLPILKKKARYVIITGVKKKEYFCMASGYGKNIRSYFKDWKLVGRIPQLPIEGDPFPRSISSYCFENPELEVAPLDKLLKGNHVQGRFYEELDKGVMPLKTRYFKMLCKRKRSLPKEDLVKRMYEKVELYESIKKNGVREPIMINKHYKILDGNHRKEILEYLGYKTAIVRKI